MFSERYKKSLVTVAMGFREEEDIKRGGLAIFDRSKKNQLVDYVKRLFKVNKNILVLKVPPKGFRSTHIVIHGDKEFSNFLGSLDEIFGKNNEIWVISSTAKDAWRCRLYISNDVNYPDMIEMAFCNDDHILDHINGETIVPYALYKRSFGKTDFEAIYSNLDIKQKSESETILNEVFKKFSRQIKDVRKDLEILSLRGISLDVILNDGIYDFRDFDVSYDEIQKIIDYYVEPYLIQKSKI